MNIYIELEKKKKKESIIHLIELINIIENKKKGKKQQYFIYFNNYNYNFNYIIGELKELSKKKIVIENKMEKLKISFNLISPIVYFIYKC